MLKITPLLCCCCLLLISRVMTRAAEKSVPTHALPLSIVFLMEPIGEGRFKQLSVESANGPAIALFSSLSVAEAFLANAPEEIRHRYKAQAVPRGVIEQMLERGGSNAVLDPTSPTQGGKAIRLDRGENLPDNAELKRLFDEDQADRRPAPDGKPVDFSVVAPRDRAREARVKEIYQTNGLCTGNDYYHAAMILQHANEPDDYLLGHHFCIVALSKGAIRAKWLAAATLDRFLMHTNRPQHFGTQYRPLSPGEPMQLYDVAPIVTDALRAEFNVPTLEVARTREREMLKPSTQDR